MFKKTADLAEYGSPNNGDQMLMKGSLPNKNQRLLLSPVSDLTDKSEPQTDNLQQYIVVFMVHFRHTNEYGDDAD